MNLYGWVLKYNLFLLYTIIYKRLCLYNIYCGIWYIVFTIIWILSWLHLHIWYLSYMFSLLCCWFLFVQQPWKFLELLGRRVIAFVRQSTISIRKLVLLNENGKLRLCWTMKVWVFNQAGAFNCLVLLLE